MSNVGGLVGIDAGVLDQHLAKRGGRHPDLIGDKRGRKLSTVHPNIDVARSGDLELLNARYRTDACDDLLGNLARRLAQFARQFEGNRECVLPELDLRRLLDDDVRNLELIGSAQELAHGFGQPAFQVSIQEVPLNY